MFQVKKKSLALVAIVTVTAALTGCGGGGGGGGDAPTTSDDASNPPKIDAPQSPITSNSGITVDNAKSVAAAVPVALSSGNFAASASQFTSTAPNTAAKTLLTIVNAAPCGLPNFGGGGTTSVTLDDADNSGNVTPPDTFTMTYNNCKFASSPETTNGTLQITNATVTGNPVADIAPWTFKGTMTLTNYGTSLPGESSVINGVVDFDSASADGKIETTSSTSSNFQIVRSNGLTVHFNALSTQATRVTSVNGTTSTSSVTGTAQINGIGEVALSTLTPWVTNNGNEYPSQGSVKFVATNQSSAVVSAINAQTAKVEIDSNGDGQVDSVQEIPWTQL